MISRVERLPKTMANDEAEKVSEKTKESLGREASSSPRTMIKDAPMLQRVVEESKCNCYTWSPNADHVEL